ncbi:DUF397 domain-containing protein [Streptomyces sp. NPDC092903]|uniref:DUF397 domain-containing protein n=1 Tax=Streptomyces sp. NPDC092903 TaxID=3366017 RepID=UPI0038147E0A
MEGLYNGMTASGIAGARWKKASASDAVNCCVEVFVANGMSVAVRDSKAPDGPALVFGHESMASFLKGTGMGGFGSLTG